MGSVSGHNITETLLAYCGVRLTGGCIGFVQILDTGRAVGLTVLDLFPGVIEKLKMQYDVVTLPSQTDQLSVCEKLCGDMCMPWLHVEVRGHLAGHLSHRVGPRMETRLLA